MNNVECSKIYVLTLITARMYIILLWIEKRRPISNTRRTLVGNYIADHPDIVGASLVGTAPTSSSFSTQHLVSMD